MRHAPAAGVSAAHGFTVIELMIGMALVLIVVACAFDLLQAAQPMLVTQPESSDLQQRLRIASDALSRDLSSAGAGFSRGATAGPLIDTLAPILPYRTGLRSPDAPGTFCADRLTVLYVPPFASQTTTLDPVTAAAATIRVKDDPGCALGDAACGFQKETPVLIADAGGRHNLFTVESVSGPLLSLTLRDATLAATFPAGAHIVGVSVHGYSLRAGSTAALTQLSHYDGYKSESPLSDDIVGVRVEYFGDPQPPILLRPVSDPQGPWTSYGPAPPAADVDDPLDSWPAGENCVFAVDQGLHLSRLPALGPPGGGLVPLGAAALTDGPWCPDAQAPNRFDADLLRVRRVRVTLRAQTVSAWLRGTAPALFARPGTSAGGPQMVPDAQLVVDVTPRNMNARR